MRSDFFFKFFEKKNGFFFQSRKQKQKKKTIKNTVTMLKRLRDGAMKTHNHLRHLDTPFDDEAFNERTLCDFYFERTRVEVDEREYDSFLNGISSDSDTQWALSEKMLKYFDREDTRRLNMEACNTRREQFAGSGMPLSVDDAVTIIKRYEDRFFEYYAETMELLPTVPMEDGARVSTEAELYELYEVYVKSIVLFLNYFFVSFSRQNVIEQRMYDPKKKIFYLSRKTMKGVQHFHPHMRCLTMTHQWHDARKKMPVFIRGKRCLEPTVDVDRKPMMRIWIEHEAHFEATGVLIPTFLGDEVQAMSETCNTWQQFEIQRKDVLHCVHDMQDRLFVRMILHIRYTWCDNDEQFLFVIGWMAFLLQRPDVRAQNTIGVLGPQGTGKSQVFEWLLQIMGKPHGAKTSSIHDVVGKFTGANRDAVFTLVDDSAVDATTADALKWLTTSDDRRLEYKGMQAYFVPNYVSWAYCHNKQLPLADDDEDRRLVCLSSNATPWMYLHGTKTVKEYAGTLIKDVLQDDGHALRTFAAFLYSIDLSVCNDGEAYDHTSVIPTHCADKIRYQRKESDPIVQWWQWRINNHAASKSRDYIKFGGEVSLDSLRNAFHDDGFRPGSKYFSFTIDRFQSLCQKLEVRENGSYFMPSLETCQREFKRNNPGTEFVNNKSKEDDVKWNYITNGQYETFKTDGSRDSFSMFRLPPPSQAKLDEMKADVYKNFLPRSLKYRVLDGDNNVVPMIDAIRDGNVRVLNDWQYRLKVLHNKEYIIE